jgi:hypothetical protein
MARTFSRAAQNYPAGVHGPFAVDGFTNANTERLHFRTTVENWPDVPLALELRIRWDTGDGGDFTWAGRPRNKDGSLATAVHAYVDVPRVADQDGRAVKMEVANGAATVVVHAAAGLRTALLLEAIATDVGAA